MRTVKKVPQRQCIGCGEMKNKRELIRVLKGTDDVISIDATGRFAICSISLLVGSTILIQQPS